MTPTEVAIRSVTLDPPFTKHPSRQRYRVTLECGCFWWEDHTDADELPRAGEVLNCYAPHSQPAQLQKSPGNPLTDRMRPGAAV